MNDDLMELSERMDRMEGLLKTIQETMLGENSDSSRRKDLTKGIVLKEATLSELERSKINDIMKNFDFNKVHDVMSYLDWNWIGCGEGEKSGVPSVEKIKEEARRLLTDAAYEKTTIATGGLRAVYMKDGEHDDDPYIGLEFIVEECEGFNE